MQLSQQIKLLEKQIATFPPGELFFRKNGRYFKYYCKTEQSTRYIPHKSNSELQTYALKKYLSQKLEDLRFEQSALHNCISSYENHSFKSEDLLSPNSGIHDLLTSSLSKFNVETETWLQESFEKNPYHPEQLKYLSISGNILRSKSELLIDTALFTHHIPFRYECSLVLDDNTIYPDFTILHPVTSELYYWEHFGLLDNTSYKQKASHKVQQYMMNGLFPSDHLITTYESENIVFTPQIIERTISLYFGNGLCED